MRYTDQLWGAKTHQAEIAHADEAQPDNLQGEERALFLGELMVEVQSLLEEVDPLLNRWNGTNGLKAVVPIILGTTSAKYILPKQNAPRQTQKSSPLGSLALLKEKLNLLGCMLAQEEGLAGIFPKLVDQIDTCMKTIWENNKRVPLQRYLTQKETQAALAPVSS